MDFRHVDEGLKSCFTLTVVIVLLAFTVTVFLLFFGNTADCQKDAEKQDLEDRLIRIEQLLIEKQNGRRNEDEPTAGRPEHERQDVGQRDAGHTELLSEY